MPLDNVTPIRPLPDRSPFDRYNTPNSPILFPVGERPVGWRMRTGEYQNTPNHKAIIRLSHTGDSAVLLNVVGSTYKVVHNRELLTNMEDTITSLLPADQLEGVQVKDRAAHYGRVCFREYVFPNIRCRIGGSTRSDIAFRMIVQNGYGGSALRIHAGAIEFYCTNGMISGEYSSVYRRHTSGVTLHGIPNVVTKALLQFSNDAERWKVWAHKPVQHEAAMNLFRSLAVSNKAKDNLMDQYMREQDHRGNSLWSVYSALTYYASHTDGAFGLRKMVGEQDSEATTMLTRELNVAKWLHTPEWRALEDA